MPNRQTDSESQLLLILITQFHHPHFHLWNWLYLYLMQNQHAYNEHALPPIPQKSISLHSVFDLIRKKKHELSKKLIDNGDSETHLPKIQQERQSLMQQLPNEEERSQQRETSEHRFEKAPFTPAKKYRTILEAGSLSQERIGIGKQISVLQLQSKQKKQITLNKKRKQNYSTTKRVKTEAQDISRKGTNTTQIQSHRMRQSQETDIINRIEQAKDKFMLAIHTIPKVMKMRNQASLLNSIQPLEIFNPFANRNHRVVNICLLKMGRTIVLNSSLLYKIGEELDCFYIILLGKVKLVNGALRKICQTGETVLEEIIFSDKHRKIALQRAKTIGRTVLLQITIEGLKKLKEELIRFGFKLGYQEMESIIKRNYIVKNWLRNKIRLEINR